MSHDVKILISQPQSDIPALSGARYTQFKITDKLIHSKWSIRLHGTNIVYVVALAGVLE
jgi:hypothetical protein